jgi:hypothetical protein
MPEVAPEVRVARNGLRPVQRKAALSAVELGFVVLMIFNVALPKGGIKLAGLPLTWGYLFAAILAVPAAICLHRRPGIVTMPLLQSACLFLPVGGLIALKAFVYGLTMSVAAVTLVQFLVLPIIMLAVLGPYLEEISTDLLATTLVWCLRFAAMWGLVNFILYPLIHSFLEVPYLTVNGADVGTIYEKNNRRGALMKLVSTYNNGNLFGICMVLLAPIYVLFEKSRVWLALFIIAAICTLSRTVWFAMAAVTGIMMLTGQIKVRGLQVWLAIVLAVCVLMAVLPLMGWTPDRLVDTSLGGRDRTFARFELSIFGGDHLTIPEIVYLGFLNSFGIVGFVFAVGALACGPLFGLLHWPRLSPLRRAAVAGLGGYMVGALIDGAFILPPVMLQFLFVTSLVYRRGLRPQAEPVLQMHRASVASHSASPARA